MGQESRGQEQEQEQKKEQEQVKGEMNYLLRRLQQLGQSAVSLIGSPAKRHEEVHPDLRLHRNRRGIIYRLDRVLL